MIETQCSLEQFLDPECQGLSKNRTYAEGRVCNASGWSWVLRKASIWENPISSIKILQSRNRKIMFGVIDPNNYSTVFPFTAHGGIWKDNRWIREDTGFDVKDRVAISVDTSKGVMSEFVNGRFVTSLQSEKLKDKNILWVPYVYFGGDDVVEWIN